MQKLQGNIWKLAKRARDVVVIPINIGYRKDGTNVMGRGLAYQARQRWPSIEIWLGEQCQLYGSETPVLIHRPVGADSRNLAFFPVKPLKPDTPWLSWDGPADLSLIARSATQLRALAEEHRALHSGASVYLPLVGCGNGGLAKESVMPIIDKYLDLPNVVLVENKQGVA